VIWPFARPEGETILIWLLVCAGWTGVSLAAALPIAGRIAFHERLPEARLALAR
jgi:hypothetical protein